MYRVIRDFTDAQEHITYHKGDTFPFVGCTVPDERLQGLSSDKNALGYPVIEEVAQERPVIGGKSPKKATEPAKRTNTNPRKRAAK